MIEKAVLLGLSTGVYCLGSCLPVLLPLTLGEERPTLRERSRPLILFSLGRFLAYAAFGAIAGWLGVRLRHPLAGTASALAMIGLSLVLIGYAATRGLPRPRACRRALRSGYVRRMPFMLGVLTGINICPPFLLAVSAAFDEGGAWRGAGFFTIFFAVTSIYLAPLVWLGRFGRLDRVRWVARVSAAVSGVVFLLAGLGRFAG